MLKSDGTLYYVAGGGNHLRERKELVYNTPYFYRTSAGDKAKLNRIDRLDLTVEFVIFEYKRKAINNGQSL